MRPEHIAIRLDTAAQTAATNIVDGDPHTVAVDLIAACERTVIELRAQTTQPARSAESPGSWTLWILATILSVGAAVGQATAGQTPAAIVTIGITGLFTAAILTTRRHRR